MTDDVQRLIDALKAMCAEFRALDLPYGSAAYVQATTALNLFRAGEQKVVAWRWRYKIRAEFPDARNPWNLTETMEVTPNNWEVEPLYASPAPDDVRRMALEEAAALCENESVAFDIDVWLHATKKEMTAKTALALAAAIRSLASAASHVTTPPTATMPDDGSCIRCGAVPRDSSGLCATCLDEDAERAGEIQSQGLWRQTLDSERVTTPENASDAADTRLGQLKKALEPFALIASEGVIQRDRGHVTVTTCAEYFHDADAALRTSSDKEPKT